MDFKYGSFHTIVVFKIKRQSRHQTTRNLLEICGEKLCHFHHRGVKSFQQYPPPPQLQQDKSAYPLRQEILNKEGSNAFENWVPFGVP